MLVQLPHIHAPRSHRSGLAFGKGEKSGEGFPSTKGLVALAVILAILWMPFAFYYVIPSTASSGTAAQTSATSGSVYKLTLVEVMDVAWNSTAMQPKFYVLGDNGFQSTANIILPVNTLIQVTIFSYDTPTPGVAAESAEVEGTVGQNMRFYNGTLATGIDNETMAQMMSLGKNVTSVPVDSVAHTFSVPQLGINIPVVGGSTEIAYLRFTQAGTYTWNCMTPCGFGADGTGGAMSTAGWMTGSLTVS